MIHSLWFSRDFGYRCVYGRWNSRSHTHTEKYFFGITLFSKSGPHNFTNPFRVHCCIELSVPRSLLLSPAQNGTQWTFEWIGMNEGMNEWIILDQDFSYLQNGEEAFFPRGGPSKSCWLWTCVSHSISNWQVTMDTNRWGCCWESGEPDRESQPPHNSGTIPEPVKSSMRLSHVMVSHPFLTWVHLPVLPPINLGLWLNLQFPHL